MKLNSKIITNIVEKWFYDYCDGTITNEEEFIRLIQSISDNLDKCLPKWDWKELDDNETFTDMIWVITHGYDRDEMIQSIAIFCLDNDMVQSQMMFYKKISPQYRLSEVDTYITLISD